jgi:hypothetical protein
MGIASIVGYSERLIRKAENGGSLSMETILNLAQALSGPTGEIRAQQLVLDILSVAREWLTAFDTLGKDMIPLIKHHMASDFVLFVLASLKLLLLLGLGEALRECSSGWTFSSLYLDGSH